MADEKKGRSEEKTDAGGNKYIQHYDEHGNKAGWSREETGVFGGKYTQHHDNDSKKTGWSEDRTGLLGDDYTQHHDNDSKKTGWSEERSARAAAASPEDLWSFTPALEIAGVRHAGLEARLFRS